ncbi:MAG: fibrobacter succinogenes major paralogous domain-containing protein [Candidatus Cryptobacteroides sp.]
MELKKIFLLAGTAVMMLPVVSCKKDKDDTTLSNSFTGTLRFSVPACVLPGDVVEAEPRGMNKDTVDIGYYWTVSPILTDKDTTRALGDPASKTGKFSFEVPDTLGVLTVNCVAFATGYYTTSASYDCVVVNPEFGKTLTEDGVEPTDPYIVDERDGKTYYYKRIGSRDWFVRNLSYTGAGISYLEAPALDDIYGKYYTWNEAAIACPEGWRLPVAADWLDLGKAAGYTGDDGNTDFLGVAGNLMVNGRFNGDRMWEYWPAVKITNSTGFSALPTGYITGDSSGHNSYGNNEYAVYWSGDTVKLDAGDEEQALYKMIYVERPDVMTGSSHKTGFYATVRCVRDAEPSV